MLKPAFASLPMYDWPEAREETDGEWNTFRDLLMNEGVEAPDRLARTNADLPPMVDRTREEDAPFASVAVTLLLGDFDLMKVWNHPQLLLAQTCWGPLEHGLEREVEVVGQADYSRFEGGEREEYSSAILVRQEECGDGSHGPMETLLEFLKGKRLAFNSADSMSGYLALERDLHLLNESLDIFSEEIETGGHRASIKAVAEGRADVCAVDCRTWDLAKRFEPLAENLGVMGWTRKRKGLPYITSRHRSAVEVEKIRKALSYRA
ncbi:hypothetical protein K458DRAFT_413735 [Lentithecium fluviatile CBS 122367]|uniref:Phosphate ABC transporter substrate-binding protein n=1 Tax=Lentithecium fluviatile CBS 122367 TaxID=1168545 RepID=A0A6G1JFY2_9PLEO|nr:hypothetical protein K458DRAFT_413735 [Lentithecium fluviatile CBS 122367]